MESIIYVISVVILISLVLLMKKSEKKLNFIAQSIFAIVCFFCYNIIICYLNNLVKIPITLITLFIENIFVSIIIGIYIFKSKSLQNYEIKVEDILAMCILFLVAIIILILNFGVPIGVKFLVSDASTHFGTAIRFFENVSLNVNGATRPGSYINIGIWFKVFEPLIGYMSLYKVFVIFDWIQWLLEACLFYFVIKRYGKKESVFKTIFPIIYMLGYSLHSFLTGFVYLSLAMLVMIALIYFLEENRTNKFKEWYKWIILFFIMFGIGFTYYFFLPVVVIAIFINEFLECKKNNVKILSKRNILFVIVIFVIPICCCFEHHFLGRILSKMNVSGKTISSIEFQMTLEGYIERNYISNFICFVPIVFMELYNSIRRFIKNKDFELNFEVIIYLTFVLFTLIMLVLNILQRLSYYGFFKCYYMLSIVTVILFAKGCIELANKKIYIKALIYFYVFMYCVVMIVYAFGANEKINVGFKKSSLDTSIYNVGHIYRVNRSFIQNIDGEFYEEENEVLDYIYNNINLKDDKILVVGTDRQIPWLKQLFKLKYDCSKQDYSKWIIGERENYRYFLIFESAKLYFKSYNFDWNSVENNSKCLIKNNSAVLYEKY